MNQHTDNYVYSKEGHRDTKCSQRAPSSGLKRKRACKEPPRCKISLGKSVYVVASEFEGEVYIHVRYYDFKKHFPTPFGIGLTPRRWNELKLVLNGIEEKVSHYEKGEEDVSYRHHLGGNFYASITQGFPCVDLRKFWLPEGAKEVCATRKGISLGFDQFRALIETVPEIDHHVPELINATPCYLEDDHQNQVGALRCAECNPNDCQNW